MSPPALRRVSARVAGCRDQPTEKPHPTRSFYLPPVAAVPALRDLGMHSGFSFARAMGVRQMIKYRYSYLKSYESKFGNSVALPPPSPPTSPRPSRLASAPALPPRCPLADLTPSSLLHSLFWTNHRNNDRCFRPGSRAHGFWRASWSEQRCACTGLGLTG